MWYYALAFSLVVVRAAQRVMPEPVGFPVTEPALLMEGVEVTGYIWFSQG